MVARLSLRPTVTRVTFDLPECKGPSKNEKNKKRKKGKMQRNAGKIVFKIEKRIVIENSKKGKTKPWTPEVALRLSGVVIVS